MDGLSCVICAAAVIATLLLVFALIAFNQRWVNEKLFAQSEPNSIA